MNGVFQGTGYLTARVAPLEQALTISWHGVTIQGSPKLFVKTSSLQLRIQIYTFKRAAPQNWKSFSTARISILDG